MARNVVAVPEVRAAALDHLTRLRRKLWARPAGDVEARAHCGSCNGGSTSSWIRPGRGGSRRWLRLADP